jgi:ppGpp synthetase/RelA/SpoT-type nucleotidyltranferase
VFGGIVVLLSVRAAAHRKEAAQALKLLFCAFFGLVVVAYLFADQAADKNCLRADSEETLSGGILGTFAIIMIVALTWLVAAYGLQAHGVLRFLRHLIYFAAAFVALLLSTSSNSYLQSEVPHGPRAWVAVLIYLTGGLGWLISLPVGSRAAVLLTAKAARRSGSFRRMAALVAERSFRVKHDPVDRCVWVTLGYLAGAAIADALVLSVPDSDWTQPRVGVAYPLAWLSLVISLCVLFLAIRALAPEEQVRRRHTAIHHRHPTKRAGRRSLRPHPIMACRARHSRGDGGSAAQRQRDDALSDLPLEPAAACGGGRMARCSGPAGKAMPTRRPSADEPGSTSPFSFTYEEFVDWYRRMENSLLEPAETTFVRLLNHRLDQELTEFDRNRIRVSSSRIKRANRVWAKLIKSKYRESVRSLDEIPSVIDDLVGVRVVCNNLCDITYLRTILSDLPATDEEPNAALALEPESAKLYIDEPKPSGYRAYHINMWTVVPTIGGIQKVRGELQVRTLLQDGWGELTHEDQYKPGFELPQLIVTMSRRMADLLATVDDLAQDLREELDRLAGEALSNRPEDGTDGATGAEANRAAGTSAATGAEATEQASYQQALVDEIRRVVQELRRPTSLATIAQRVRSIFGDEITRGWGGFTNFKALLYAAVPDVEIVETGPGYVFPKGYAEPLELTAPYDQSLETEVPAIIAHLHQFDKSIPLINGVRLGLLLTSLVDVLSPSVWAELGIRGPIDIRELNQLSRYGRDAADRHGEKVTRPHLDYALKALMWSGNLRPGLTLSEVIDILGAWLVSRATFLGLVTDAAEAREEIDRWLEEGEEAIAQR